MDPVAPDQFRPAIAVRGRPWAALNAEVLLGEHEASPLWTDLDVISVTSGWQEVIFDTCPWVGGRPFIRGATAGRRPAGAAQGEETASPTQWTRGRRALGDGERCGDPRVGGRLPELVAAGPRALLLLGQLQLLERRQPVPGRAPISWATNATSSSTSMNPCAIESNGPTPAWLVARTASAWEASGGEVHVGHQDQVGAPPMDGLDAPVDGALLVAARVEDDRDGGGVHVDQGRHVRGRTGRDLGHSGAQQAQILRQLSRQHPGEPTPRPPSPHGSGRRADARHPPVPRWTDSSPWRAGPRRTGSRRAPARSCRWPVRPRPPDRS